LPLFLPQPAEADGARPRADPSRFIFGTIFSRCKDSANSVRARALQTLAEMTMLPHVVKKMFRCARFSK
jgi:hypothetical protein